MAHYLGTLTFSLRITFFLLQLLAVKSQYYSNFKAKLRENLVYIFISKHWNWNMFFQILQNHDWCVHLPSKNDGYLQLTPFEPHVKGLCVGHGQCCTFSHKISGKKLFSFYQTLYFTQSSQSISVWICKASASMFWMECMGLMYL